MKVVHVAAELYPLAKVGGLGEATFGLLHASNSKIQAAIILPYYPWIKKNAFSSIKKEVQFTVTVGKKEIEVLAYKAKLKNFTVILLKEDLFFNRDKVYGYKDDTQRFLFLSKASIKFLSLVEDRVDILHLHDWHTAPCLPIIKDLYPKATFKKTILSIHNLCYQGHVQKKLLQEYGIEKSLPALKDEHQKNGYNLLKGGIELADLVIAVSPTYAEEIRQKDQCFGLFKTINKNKKKITGILNGIDTSIWNPEKDPFLKRKYHAKLPISKIRKAKQENKQSLFKELNLSISDKPLVAYIGRLSEQKGLELIEHAIKRAKKLGYQFVLLGSSTDKKIDKHFHKLKKTYSSDDVQLYIGFNEKLAHLIYASADFMIIPSVFEPCGLVQIISFHYGTVPIGRKTGGLSDTIVDKKNGYLFDTYSEKSFDTCLKNAITNFPKKAHEKLIEQSLKQNYCWSFRISDYIKKYK